MILCNLFLFVLLILEGSAKRRLRNNTSENSSRFNLQQPSRLWETTKMDVHLIELSDIVPDREQEGFLDITLSSSPRSLQVCFPPFLRQYRQVYLLGHVACRQMGYVTAMDVVGKRVPKDSFTAEEEENPEAATMSSLPLPKGLSPVSWNCAGNEQNIAHCAWYSIKMEGCRLLTELSCGECRKSFRARSGFIRTPGYPVAQYFDLMCDWTIQVPDSHSISLVFNHLNTLPMEESDFHCANNKPYIELIHGGQGSFTIKRHCDFRNLKNVTIPYHQVLIRYFSGSYEPRGFNIFDKEQGLAIAFKAIPKEPQTFLVDALIVILVTTICLAVLVWFIRRTLWFRMKHNRAPAQQAADLPSNAPGFEELERAYEFQRCNVQPHLPKPGLRLRSNGSRKTSENKNGETITEKICSSFRKFSSNSNTPRNMIPSSLKSYQARVAKLQMIANLKANLLERYSKGGSTTSTRQDSCSSVFLPVPGQTTFNFPIYHSSSSEPPKQEDKKDPSLVNDPDDPNDPATKVVRIPPQETAI